MNSFNLLNKNSLQNLYEIYYGIGKAEFSPIEIIKNIKESRKNTGAIYCQNWDCENDVRFFYCACAIQKYLELYDSEENGKT